MKLSLLNINILKETITSNAQNDNSKIPSEVKALTIWYCRLSKHFQFERYSKFNLIDKTVLYYTQFDMNRIVLIGTKSDTGTCLI